jgi:hypothetical protein
LSSFPASNALGASALAWATTGRKVFGATLHCPKCGQPMTFDEEIARRRRFKAD